MSENQHVDNALDWQHGDSEPSTFALSNALIEATLALAYEQRTANLIAAYQSEVSGQGRIKGDGIAIDRHNEILDRLGL